MSEVAELEELEPRPAGGSSWISRVVLADVELELERVLASLTIRHGRDDVSGGLQSTTATLPLRNIHRDELTTFQCGVSLVIYDLNGLEIFTGQVSDLELVDDDPLLDDVLTVTATSSLALAGRRNVGGHSWPAETWSQRMRRILDEAGLVGIVQAPSPDVPMAATVPDPDSGAYPSMSALDALEADREAVGSTAYDDELGRIVVQAFDGRGALEKLLMDAGSILYAPAWGMTLDVVNRVVLGYGYGAGSVTVDELVSQGVYGVRWTGVFDSGLADATTATRRAQVWLDRLTFPRWKMPGLTILGRAPLQVGMRLELSQLPASAPLSAWTPIVEGWTDTVDGDDWTQDVVLSDPIFSGLALRWQDVTAGLRWQDVSPACRWTDADVIDNLTRSRELAYA